MRCFVNMQLVAYWAPLNLLCCLRTLPCHAYLNRTCIIIGCASCHVYACVFTMLFASFRLCSFSIVHVSLRLWGFVRLRGIVLFMDSFFFLAGSQARWPFLDITSIVAMLDASLFCFVTIPILLHVSPHLAMKPLTTHLANHCLSKLSFFSSPLL